MTAPIASSVPEEWTDRVQRLGSALSAISSGGHHLSLGLAGALLHRGVAPNVVPSIVDAATARAGWTAPTPDHYRRNAADTVARWVGELPIRSDVLPELVPVLDEITSTPTEPTVSLEDMQYRLYHAINDAGDGLSVVRVPCGAGKTFTARQIATQRHAAGLRTTISVPTNELAEQIAADLRAAGVPTLRLFGPTAPKRPDGRPVCEYHASAVHLANGWQSVRWELCEGRGKDPCPYRQTCTAADGMDGPHDALVVVGNHGLLSQLDRATGVRGLLIIDEPPHVLDDQSLTDDDLVEAYEQLGKFELGYRYAPAIALARAWLREGQLDAFHSLADVDPDVPDLGALLEQAEFEDVATAVEDTIPQRARAPQADRLQLITTRSDATRAGRLGRASRVLTVLYRALTDAGVRTVVYEAHRSKERQMAVVGVEQQLHAALQRDGRVVVTAADAHLYLQHYEDVVGYRPPLVELGAPDGCQVRRVLVEARSLGRSKRPTIDLVCRALEEAAQGHDHPRVALVTFQAWEPWARGVAEAWAREHGAEVAVGHYMALRGLDHWRDFDALVTLGDPIPNVHHVARTTEDDVFERAKLLARAELEQAHGRLRVVHRTTPCTQLHVGRLMPFGWPAPPKVEVHRPPKGRPPGRPARERVDGDMLQQAVDAIGGVRAAARWLTSEGAETSHTTVRRWLRGECAPPPKVVASLRAAAQRGKRNKRDSRVGR